MREYVSESNRFLSNFLPPACKTILVINVVVTLMLAILIFLREPFVIWFGQTPALSLLRLHVWQFVTYAFIHLAIGHLFFNMLALFFFGPPLEQRWGTKRFWQFYLVSAAGAGLFHAVLTVALGLPDAIRPVIGASGAIFGILVAFWAYYPDQMVLAYFVFPIKMKYLMPIVMLFTFLSSADSGPSRISHLTHLTGAGAAYLWLAWRHRTFDCRTWRWTRDW